MNIKFRETDFNVDQFEHCSIDREKKTISIKLSKKEPIIMGFADTDELNNAFDQFNELIYFGFRQHLENTGVIS
jgi:hypothetical protein